MDIDFTTIFITLGLFTAGLACGLFIIKPRAAEDLETIQRKANDLLEKNRKNGEQIIADAQKRAEELKERSLEHEEKLKIQVEKVENLIVSKEEQLQLKTAKNEEIKTFVEKENAQMEALRQKNLELEKELTQKLATKTGLKITDIKDEIMSELQRDLELEREDRLHKHEEYLQEEKERIAKNFITNVIQRYSAPTSVDKRSADIVVPRDEIKGRIIGRNAENLLLIEELTGVDVVFNDSPDTIIISCFDLVRRHIARETIAKLVKERIVTLDKVRLKLKESQLETERTLIRIGQETVKMLGLEKRNFPPEFMRIIGRLKFRTSYGQNILKHSFEVGYFTLMLGSELDLNMETAKIAGFFHDLGKAIDQEVGGSHDVLTKEIMEKYTFSEDEIHAAWAHHDAVPQRTAEAMLVKAGDAISAGRPGARQESLEKYIQRIQAIESIASSYEGVSKTFAISAGREVRVMVEPHRLDDIHLPELAKSIAQEIQGNVAYPGKIKVNIIRRTKNTDYAKSAAVQSAKKAKQPVKAQPQENSES